MITTRHIAAAAIIAIILLVIWLQLSIARVWLSLRRDRRQIEEERRRSVARGFTARRYPPFHPEQP